jgi:Cu2+-exporting ATPase/Cu+-exporting ATPase
MGRHIAEVLTRPGGSLATVARQLKKLGYPPHPVAWSDLHGESQSKHNKSLLLRIGVAGACAGNIMLITTALYAGADRAAVARAFEWLTFGLFLPVLLYSAVPFYKNTWAALRNRRSSIDVPIAAAVIIGSVIGLYHLVVGVGDIYFDSLAVLVFLLLSSRYLLSRLQSHFLSPSRLRAFYETGKVRVVNPQTGSFENRHIENVQQGELVLVKRGERIPVDGTLLADEAYVNAAVLTGEVQPQRILEKQGVFAGTQLTSDEARIRVDQTGPDTRIGKLLAETERGVLSRTPLISLTDRVAQWFSATVLGLGVVFALAYSFVDVPEAINRALALVILACPCALALATPLAQSLALRKAAKRGCLIKKADAFEKLIKVRSVFFDKTGTLTKGELNIKGWWPVQPTDIERAVIRELESDSQHPVARLLTAHVTADYPSGLSDEDLGLTGKRETTGVGVEGRFNGDRYELRSIKDERDYAGAPEDLTRGALTTVGLYKNGEFQKAAAFSDTVRDASQEAVARFKERGLDVYLLTGDAGRPAGTVAEHVGVDSGNVLAEKSPEDKRSILGAHPRPLMVGDGVNDSVALATAHVSVAVQGSMEASFKAADIYLTQPGLRPLVDLMDLSDATISIIKRNLLFSLVYNATFGTLALLGYINPLLAAVLMPASSITVVLSAVIGNGFWRRFGRESVTEWGLHAEPSAPVPAAVTKGGEV